ncbi:MAG: nucleotidyltransferase domain-containing protein [Bacteroidales bacterium]
MGNNIIILKELKQLLNKELGNNILEVILFGSKIKKTSTFFSDFDVLIILKNDYDWNYKDLIRELCYDISLKYDIIVDSKIISLNELNHSPKGKDPLYQDAIKDGIYA